MHATMTQTARSEWRAAVASRLAANANAPAANEEGKTLLSKARMGRLRALAATQRDAIIPFAPQPAPAPLELSSSMRVILFRSLRQPGREARQQHRVQ